MSALTATELPLRQKKTHNMRAKSASTTAIPGDVVANGNGHVNGHTNGHTNGCTAVDSADKEALNIIIPIGGIGSRFQREGYRFPKPLINIVGRPMISWLIERLSVQPHDTVWIAINEEIDSEFHVSQLMRKWFPRLDIRLLRLNYMTQGATETLFIVSQSIPESYRSRRTISLDCDTIYFADILSRVRRMPAGHGACFYFEDTGNQPIFSYIRTNTNKHGHEVIHDIQEKKAISTKANSGAYVFPSAAALNTWAEKMLDTKLDPSDEKTGEYYTSQMIEVMITSGVPFIGLHITVDDFSCVGTPRQLREFLQRIKNQDKGIVPKKQRFCFDLDSTLVGVPEVSGDYSTCPPIWRNIELVRALHASGHHIIIQTARRMRTHSGNVGAVIADIGLVTLSQLAKYEIPYDDIFFGKPYANLYIDDLAVNANLDTFKELGWLAESTPSASDNALADAKNAKKAGIVASRTFNHMQIVGERLIKSSKSSQILGEMYFYTHLPEAIAGFFPAVSAVSYLEETEMYSFTMEKLTGLTYSHLLVGRSLTPRRLRFLLHALRSIHDTPSSSVRKLEVPAHLEEIFTERTKNTPNIYANYGGKMRARYAENEEVYAELGSERTSKILRILTTRLDAYEREKRGMFTDVIHGDPVFSNAILDETRRKVFLFDVRSQLGNTLTTAGDICYDLGKVLQSLHGYDHIILANEDLFIAGEGDARATLDAIIKTEDRQLLLSLQDVFWDFVDKEYEGRVRRQDVLDVMASLLFSLIPLHRPQVRGVFLMMCENVMEYGMACPLI